MDRHWRKAAWRCSAVVLAVAGVFPVASGIAAATEASAFPRQLVGTWTRQVTATDIKRAGDWGDSEVPPGAVFRLTIRKNGSATLTARVRPSGWSGVLVPAGTHRVHINLPFVFPNTYKWRASGRLLTFTKISDSDPDGFRQAVFSGVWKRK